MASLGSSILSLEGNGQTAGTEAGLSPRPAGGEAVAQAAEQPSAGATPTGATTSAATSAPAPGSSTAAPQFMPAPGVVPTGAAPAGSAPAGSAPAGTTPAGTTPAGTTPAGIPAGVPPGGASTLPLGPYPPSSTTCLSRPCTWIRMASPFTTSSLSTHMVCRADAIRTGT